MGELGAVGELEASQRERRSSAAICRSRIQTVFSDTDCPIDKKTAATIAVERKEGSRGLVIDLDNVVLIIWELEKGRVRHLVKLPGAFSFTSP